MLHPYQVTSDQYNGYVGAMRVITSDAMMPHPSWLVAFLVFPICGFLQTSLRHSTALAVERTDDQIAIAADSRVTEGNDNIVANTCKIRSAGKWYFALNGTASTKNVDVFSVVGTILRRRGDIAGRSKLIVDSLTLC
jgi:hypothetical protein